ncbi:MAG TPA: hypothetical protein VFA04_11460 [Bryobacteraceae bacterium]|nr:hypothetical protein [Bryobacteraceae bacterium]
MRRLFRAAVLAAIVFGLLVATAVFVWQPRYAYMPAADKVLNRYRKSPESYDLWGQPISGAGPGVVAVNDAMLRLGREAFYKETFGNEVFLTDVAGIIAGPLNLRNITSAIVALHGEGTTNLQVTVEQTVTVGGRTFQKGAKLDTGLDVPRGAWLPLGMAVQLSRRGPRVGITCAACHATVDPKTHQVIEGAPNNDLNAGLLLALATNSASFFTHTDVRPEQYTKAGAKLPDVKAFEDAVDAELMKWPRGNFDSMIDLVADPSQIPTSFSFGNHPYSWSGLFGTGPFHGLSAQTSNVHGLNSDATLLADSSPALFGIDRDTYLGIVLQNAADKALRYDPRSGRSASDFFRSADPTPGAPGINEVVTLPTYPKATPISPDSVLASTSGRPVWQQCNAMAAFENTIVPPRPPLPPNPAMAARGRSVLQRAGCVQCHSGRFLTNNAVLPVDRVGTEPARAAALAKTAGTFTDPVLYSFDTPVPVPADASVLHVPVPDAAQVALAWAHGNPGGYKVPALVGLYYSAPYLHDGGVAVGPRGEMGVEATVQSGIAPDPRESLRALVDRGVRGRVVDANSASTELAAVHVRGSGHEFWADKDAGFTYDEQEALIYFLLTYDPNDQ